MTIRIRMTLWYGAVLAMVIAVFGTSVYLMMAHQLRVRLDAELARELAGLMEEVEEAKDHARLRERLDHRFAGHAGYEYQVASADGVILFKSERLREHTLPIPAIPGSLRQLDYESVPLGSRSLAIADLGRVRVASELVPGPGGAVVIQVAASLAPDDHELGELLLILLLAGPLSLAAALGGGYVLARKALAPVDRMAATASEITATRLGRRLDVPDQADELGRLARTLNDMIARLDRSFEEIRRFTADAAHELRTPLAVLRSEAEVALRAPRAPEQYRQVIETMLEEVHRLTRLAERLLFLCREDAGLVPIAREPVPFDEVLREVADHMGVVAEEKGLALDATSIAPGWVLGDEDQLRRLLFNLVDNAVKFTPAGGTITVRGGNANDGRYRVVIADTGIGIPAEHLPHVFERFYRADPARGQEVEGAGLGLAISRSIAKAHAGEIRVESTVGVGTEFSLILPLLDPSDVKAQRARHRESGRCGRSNEPAEPCDTERFDPCCPRVAETFS